MKPYYEDSAVQVFHGDCRSVLAELQSESVQCCVTSPPYWGLRKYAGEQDIVWGDNHCEHEWGMPLRTQGHHAGETNPGLESHFKDADGLFDTTIRGNTCSLCGAWRGAYGLEPTPEMYVAHTIEILRAIRRVLRKDGVVFWNIGDSYWAGKGSNGSSKARRTADERGYVQSGGTVMMDTRPQDGSHDILKPKDLCLIPFRVALSAQADGWWCRSVIIWSKSNPMPESVKDRPTESHEYILMLTRSKDYYWDIEAVREPCLPVSLQRAEYAWHQVKTDDMVAINNVSTERMGERFVNPAGRNLRSVWEINTQPYPEAHFATFPEKIPERCILAATSEKGNCSKCGKPWVRIVKRQSSGQGKASTGIENLGRGFDRVALREITRAGECESKTLGWKPQCQCEAPSEPPVVLDPFSGSGTTLWVAKRLGRRAIGIDTSSQYCDLAIERNRQQAMVIF